MTDIDIICHPVLTRHKLFESSARNLGVNLLVRGIFDFTFQFNLVIQQTNYQGELYKYPDIIYFYAGNQVGLIRNQLITLARSQRTLIFDRCLRENPYWQASKFMEACELSQKSIPIIPTLVVSNFEQFKKQIKNDYPVIAKLANESQGKGVFRCQTDRDVTQIFQTFDNQPILFQPFIQNSGDYRVLVIGDKCIGAVKRTRKNLSEEFLNNLSQGGVVTQVDLTTEMESLALTSAELLGIDIAGVDLIDINGSLHVMEINRSPQFQGFMQATGIDVPKKIIEYLATQIV